MLTRNVTTTSEQLQTGALRNCNFSLLHKSDQASDELKAYASLFELLSNIDQRLKNEDPEYRAKYYPEG